MLLKCKKICLMCTLALLLAAVLSVSVVYVAHASETENYAYQEGTSYSSKHDVNKDTDLWNNAEEAHALYRYYQNSDLLPVQVYFAVYPHMVGDSNVTMNCNISMKTKYKVWGFLWSSTKTSTTDVTYDDLYEKTHVIGQVDGPSQDAITNETTFTFSDAMYGNCTWTIIAE